MSTKDLITLSGLKIQCIIGIFDWERKQKQDVVIDLKFPTDIPKAARFDRISDATDYKIIAKTTIAFVEKSRFQLIETLAERLASLLLLKFGMSEIWLRVSKPGAVRGSQNVGIEITRQNSSFDAGLVYFSLGSNLNPAYHLKNALRELDSKFGLIKVSHAYETSPVGARKKQPNFWNMVVAVNADEKPKTIREWIGKLEKKEDRIRTKDPNGSRTLDVDLILWKNQVIRGKDFEIPHLDIRTKAFVLFPLLEISPQLVMPGTDNTLIELAHSFEDKRQTLHQLRNLPPSTFKI